MKIYQEHPDDTWSSNGVRYNINKILEIAHDKESQELSTENFKSQVRNSKIEVDGKLVCGSCNESSRDHQKRVEETDYSIPIIAFEENEKWRVVDGAHRVEKALNENRKTIPVKILTEEDLLKAKI